MLSPWPYYYTYTTIYQWRFCYRSRCCRTLTATIFPYPTEACNASVGVLTCGRHRNGTAVIAPTPCSRKKASIINNTGLRACVCVLGSPYVWWWSPVCTRFGYCTIKDNNGLVLGNRSCIQLLMCVCMCACVCMVVLSRGCVYGVNRLCVVCLQGSSWQALGSSIRLRSRLSVSPWPPNKNPLIGRGRIFWHSWGRCTPARWRGRVCVRVSVCLSFPPPPPLHYRGGKACGLRVHLYGHVLCLVHFVNGALGHWFWEPCPCSCSSLTFPLQSCHSLSVSLCLSLSLPLSLCHFFPVSLCLFLSLSFSLSLSLSVSLCLSLSLSLFVSLSLSVCLSVSLSLSVCLSHSLFLSNSLSFSHLSPS